MSAELLHRSIDEIWHAFVGVVWRGSGYHLRATGHAREGGPSQRVGGHVVHTAEQMLERFSSSTLDDLVAAIAQDRGRPISIVEFKSDTGPAICGLWLALPQADLLFIADDLTGVHREHVVVHELAHILLDHNVIDSDLEELAAELFPSLPPELVRRILGRSTYSNPQERAAEDLATKIIARTRSTGRSAWINAKGSRSVADVMGQAHVD